MKELIVGIHQPNFMPWPGYFNKIFRSDIFVIIDQVQFVKGSVCNRTKIKTSEGKAEWLTVPVRFENGSTSTFQETKIADPHWYKKALNLLKNSYIKAPYFKNYSDDLLRLLSQEYPSLAAMNITLIKYLCQKLEIITPIYVQSELETTFGKKNYLNLGITQYFKGTTYLSGEGARKYNDESVFETEGIAVRYLGYKAPLYNQINGPFIEGLSVADLLFNEGSESIARVKIREADH